MSVKQTKKKAESILEKGIRQSSKIGDMGFKNFEKTEDYGVAKVTIGAIKTAFQGISLLCQSKRLTGKPGDLVPYTGE